MASLAAAAPDSAAKSSAAAVARAREAGLTARSVAALQRGPVLRPRPAAGLVEVRALADGVTRRAPARAGGRILPVPRDPGVLHSAPVPVARDPYRLRVRRRGTRLTHRRGRRAGDRDAGRRQGRARLDDAARLDRHR